jgi:hypothetical protein
VIFDMTGNCIRVPVDLKKLHNIKALRGREGILILAIGVHDMGKRELAGLFYCNTEKLSVYGLIMHAKDLNYCWLGRNSVDGVATVPTICVHFRRGMWRVPRIRRSFAYDK